MSPRFLLCASLAVLAIYGTTAEAAEPVIRPLVPGIVVEELPVTLPNINNLRFSPQGELTALGYNGQVYLLSDTNGDGIEDAARPYWDQATISVPVGMAWSADGLYVSSHGKVSLLKDSDDDGKADGEEIVAQSWPPTDVASGGVDATAVTLDEHGNLYFGLLCADYSNPYRVQDGVSRYDRNSLRGTIVKLSKGQTKLETICTGVRVPYTLAFNREGDLFLTDQEGATWLPGGNPVDELNHIQQGKHYGFPFRHPQYLPDVVDEPPVVGFGPQHQSTCGLIFNDARDNQPPFGPADWEGDALVAGFSRGKLWRVRLIKTPSGYIGKQTLIATSAMLLADMAISPRGDLYVCCHSGPPDWGTGPQGEGKLFRMRYVGRDEPQPVLAWPAGPLETRIAFDRPAPSHWDARLSEAAMEFGEHVRAADRFEVLKPPYEVVEQQAKVHRGKLGVAAARWSDDRRTLVLTTDPLPVRASYAVSVPLPVRAGAEENIPLDVDYRLNGVQATWTPAEAEGKQRSIWLPHFDFAVSRALTRGSADHDAFFPGVKGPGALAFETTLRLEAPCHLQLRVRTPFDASLDGGPPLSTGWTADLWYKATIELAPGDHKLRLTSELDQDRDWEAEIGYYAPQTGWRAVHLEQLFVPWAPAPLPPAADDAAAPMRRIAGDVAHGEQLFFGQEAKCGTCHAVRGKGAKFAPDLGNLAHRDQTSVLRDIREPSAAINPDYVSYSLALRDGRTLSGIVRAEGLDQLRLLDQEAKETLIPRADVAEIAPNAISAMPQGLLDKLDATQVQDLLAFLLTEPAPKSPDGHEFPRRADKDVKQVLSALPTTMGDTRRTPLNIVLVSSAQDHGPGEHDYPNWQKVWQPWLAQAEGVTVDVADVWPSPEQWQRANIIVFYFWNHDWSAERFAQLDAYLARGGGAVALHAGVISDNDPEELAKRWGLAAQPVRTKYRHGPLDLAITVDAGRAITAGFQTTHFVDETYWPMIGDRTKVNVLATTIEEGAEQPMAWTHEVGRGRVFATILGHYTVTLDDPLFRILVLRGLAWAAHQPESRLQSLVNSK